MPKTHDRDHFHKYVTGPVAVKILDALQVRWSSARLFNDPFDTQVDLRFDFSVKERNKRLEEEIEKLIFSETEPIGDETKDNFIYFKKLWKDRANLDRTKLRRIIKSVIEEETHRNTGEVFEACRESWGTFLSELKIFCVAEKHDNLLMWAHYSDSHMGAVIRFKCIPEEDTALCAAIPVRYDNRLPYLDTVDSWVKRLIGLPYEFDSRQVFERYVCTKSSDWSYEKEWRVLVQRDHEDGEGVVLLSVLPAEIDAVYLGCKIPVTIRVEIAKRLTGPLQHVDLFQAKMNETHFALEFTLISRGKRA